MQRPLWNLLNYASHCTVWWLWSQIYQRFWFQGDGEKPWRYSFSKVEMERLSFLLNISWNHQLIIKGWQGFGNDELNCFIDIANGVWPLFLGVHPMVFGLFLVLGQVSLSNDIIHSFCPSYFLFSFHHRFSEFKKNIGDGFLQVGLVVEVVQVV